ncbi:MAG: energy transducer TonB [Thermoanaerobaculia bacterium]
MKRTQFIGTLCALSLAMAGVLVAGASAESTKAELVLTVNPAAPGFLADESDAEAIALADRVMTRLGGREAWDTTRYVTWRFFGRRLHVWDRHSGDIRVEGTDRETEEPYLVLMNLHTKQGRAWQAGQEVSDPESLSKLLELGESAWINDSYWVFMPFKLKDTGVALRHIGQGELLDGRPAEVLELTFREVGRTPENKYHVYVAGESGLVEQWDFFTTASDEAPRFQIPWRNWRRHGSILLSDDRGRGQHTGIAVLEEVPTAAFSSPEPVDLASLPSAATGGLTEAPIYSVEGDVVKPQVSHSVAPEYPAAAKDAGTTGLVVVRTVIASNGSIRDAWVTQPLDPALDAAALEAVRDWTFEPATLDGKAVDVYYNLTINFQLDGDDGGSDG